MYGTVEGVAALSAQWTDDGEFTDFDELYSPYDPATNPSLSQVTDWLTRVSLAVDVRLADEGFVTPVEVPQAVADISMLVEGIVKDLADYSHGSGRFYTKQALESGLSPYLTIDKDVSDWVARRSIGLTNMGVPKLPKSARTEASFEVM